MAFADVLSSGRELRKTSRTANQLSRAGRKSLAQAILFLSCAALVGCQAIGDAALVEQQGASADRGSPLFEPVGTGSVIVGLSLPETTTTSSRDFRDGAALAASELASEIITLVPLRGSKTTDRGELAAIVGAGIEESGAAADVPVIAMGDGGNYDIASDEIASAVFMIDRAVAAGRSEIAVLAPQAMTEQGEVRLREAAKAPAKLRILRYAIDGEDARFAESPSDGLSRSNALLVMGDGAAPGHALAMARQAGLPAGMYIMGTTGWGPGSQKKSAAEGALLPRIKGPDWNEVASLFNERYGREFSVEAAYGFDAVAVLSGLVRVHGASALSPALMRSPAGFKGVTGMFRFVDDGAVERTFGVKRIENGALVSP